MQINLDDSIFDATTIAAALIGAFIGFIIGSFVPVTSSLTGLETLPIFFDHNLDADS